jgi:hypothetical protein
MSTDFAIALLLSEGYRIDSLYMAHRGWCASVRYETPEGRLVIEFGFGSTPSEALMNARSLCQTFIDTKAVVGWGHKRITGRGLLRELGL